MFLQSIDFIKCKILYLYIVTGEFFFFSGREQRLNETQIHQKSSSNNISRSSDTEEDIDEDECSEGQDIEHRLIKNLLYGYDKNVRPIKNKRMAIQVEFDLAYNQLVDLVRNSYHIRRRKIFCKKNMKSILFAIADQRYLLRARTINITR